MSVGEDRRRLAVRLNVLQWGAVGVFTALAMSFWFLQVVQHARVRGDGREQPPADARPAGAARRAVRPQRHRPGREPALVHHFDRARALEGPDAHGARCSRRWRTSIRSRCSRSSIGTAPSRRIARSSSSRTRRWRRWPPSPRAASTPSSRTWSSRKCRRGVIRRRRWRRTSSAMSARPTTRRWRPAPCRAPSSASRGSRRPTTTC